MVGVLAIRLALSSSTLATFVVTWAPVISPVPTNQTVAVLSLT